MAADDGGPGDGGFVFKLAATACAVLFGLLGFVPAFHEAVGLDPPIARLIFGLVSAGLATIALIFYLTVDKERAQASVPFFLVVFIVVALIIALGPQPTEGFADDHYEEPTTRLEPVAGNPQPVTFAFLHETTPAAEGHQYAMLAGLDSIVEHITRLAPRSEFLVQERKIWRVEAASPVNNRPQLAGSTLESIQDDWCHDDDVVFAVGLVQSSTTEAFLRTWAQAGCEPLALFTVGPTSSKLRPPEAPNYPLLQMAPPNRQQARQIVEFIGRSFPWERPPGGRERPCAVEIVAQAETDTYWKTVAEAFIVEVENRNPRRGRCRFITDITDVETIRYDAETHSLHPLSAIRTLADRVDQREGETVLVVVGMQPFSLQLLHRYDALASADSLRKPSVVVITDGSVTSKVAEANTGFCLAGAFPAGGLRRNADLYGANAIRWPEKPDFFSTTVDGVYAGVLMVDAIPDSLAVKRRSVAAYLELFLAGRGHYHGGAQQRPRVLPGVRGYQRFNDQGLITEMVVEYEGDLRPHPSFHIYRAPPGSQRWAHRTRDDMIQPYCEMPPG